jgi:hypothetical protein
MGLGIEGSPGGHGFKVKKKEQPGVQGVVGEEMLMI